MLTGGKVASINRTRIELPIGRRGKSKGKMQRKAERPLHWRAAATGKK